MNKRYHKLRFDSPSIKNVVARFIGLFDVKHTNGVRKPNSIFGEDNGYLYKMTTRRGDKILATSLNDMGKEFKGRVYLSFKYNSKTDQKVRIKYEGDVYYVASVNFINQ
jgi:hypothetical protein